MIQKPGSESAARLYLFSSAFGEEIGFPLLALNQTLDIGMVHDDGQKTGSHTADHRHPVAKVEEYKANKNILDNRKNELSALLDKLKNNAPSPEAYQEQFLGTVASVI